MIKRYQKLVRDKIPEIIEQRGGHCEIRSLGKDEYWKCLKEKLEEEVAEFKTAVSVEDQSAELADIYEVLDGLLSVLGLDYRDVMQIKNQKRQSRGGFENRLFLESVEESDCCCSEK